MMPETTRNTEDHFDARRRKRKQVSRACDWCRARKIRCDNAQPCEACRHRDAPCTNRGADDKPRTLPQALRETEKLKLRIKELEALLDSRSPVAPAASSNLSTLSRARVPSDPDPTQFPTSPASKPQWKGIYVDTARSGRPSYYGAASSFYFLSRIGSFLANALQQPHATQSIQLRGPNKRVYRDAPREAADNAVADLDGMPTRGQGLFMSRLQEEAVLRLFWEGYHCLVPIVDETQFRTHYASLWESRSTQRAQSALVDIILAINLQFGYAYMPPAILGVAEAGRDVLPDDATSAGRAYYRRAQSLLFDELESPSIATVQCCIFATYYLCCASFQNTAHVVLAQAVRTAQILGLHTEPSADLPYAEEELRKRVWWTVWMTDTKISSKLGRPCLIDRALVTVSLFSDGRDAATANDATLGFHDNVTWLTYALQNLRLFQTLLDVFDPLWEQFGRAIHRKDLSCIYTDPDTVEGCAVTLAQMLPAMKTWADNVPSGLKMRRRGGGEPYSTSCLAVEIDTLVPTWLQRQRVCLELTYHHAVFNLTRPFITFFTHPGTYTPVAERLATTSVDHAVSFALIMHQFITEADVMSCWSEYFAMQWNATITLVGFILAYPIHQATQKARRAVDKALVVLDTFGAHFAISNDAAAITRDLVTKADLLAGHSGSAVSPALNTTPLLPGAAQDILPAESGINSAGNDLSWLDPSQQDGFSQFMDWALSVDAYNSFERFFTPGISSFT
ncbi:fungal specific transcription factor domain protein [Sporothrix schenckii 1099-18]|uniref:Fungal specific transcription factor domain protein n=1 Tax=Sporothrix schenckii 1099-18 TaxID=1397361 RepID=A0A0F2MJN0_SPOSC|nr:fungal specific transcription factor domain protein [Sporothrix schenckii 1099-18]KJR89030.1 fungal specific transcription factor domain protein [Sporothrix schenckii 1099-18]